MKISSDEITSVIKKQIENYKVDLNVDEQSWKSATASPTYTDWKTACPANCSNFRTAYTAWL